jgi:four helix bundle suffix protein
MHLQKDANERSMTMQESVFSKRGGYRQLDTFMLATIIYYTTVEFCRRHVTGNRQVEQMVQAARSGRQNLAEGSERAGTSTQTEMTLNDVARASLAELQLDFEDFINLHGEFPWKDNDENSSAIRSVRLERTPMGENKIHNFSVTVAANRAKFARWLESDHPLVVANALVCLCIRTDYLIRKQLAALGKNFLEEGGFRERLTRQRESARADPDAPVCPECGKPMRLRQAKRGPNAGHAFWGCTGYPQCQEILKAEMST